MSLNNNYYFSSFFWSTLQKFLNAIVGFISVPLLLSYYGADNYGIISLATACNGYMHLLDLGMNVGAVRYFTLWRSKGDIARVNRVSRTNITFYGIIAFINILMLVFLAFYGESLFATTHEQFTQFRLCLFIIAFFSIWSWGTTTFNQLLIAAKQMAFTAQVQSLQTVLKMLLVGAVFLFDMNLTIYFFFLTAITAFLIIPYSVRCKRFGLIDSIKPATYWSDFKVVLTFSLSIFALSLFQTTAIQTRPIVLGIFSSQGPSVNAEFRIIEVIPQLIITIAGSFSSIFLPKTTEIVSKGITSEIKKFAYKWTILTTIITNFLCFPFIIGAEEILGAYVGPSYSYLTVWLIIWIILTLLQMHSTPATSLIYAYGKTKLMVYISGTACVVSIIVNALLAERIGVGAAVIGYVVYILINLTCYYSIYYKRVLGVSIIKILTSFLQPTVCGMGALLIVVLIIKPHLIMCSENERISFLTNFGILSFVWCVIYITILLYFKIIIIRGKDVLTKYDN